MPPDPAAPDWLTPAEILAAQPLPPTGDPVGAGCARMHGAGQWHARQSLGRRFAIGCVALEVTQRCNLDCTLCYLSEHAEAVRDLPLPELFRRIEGIHAQFGPHTEVQVTGGEPTLRPVEDLVAVVRAITGAGMRASLFTNGIRATRPLLAALAEAGLSDVAFHVDTTQQRSGYADEVTLNAVRAEYLERARGLGLAVVFNTTVHDGNFAEIPAVAGFFRDHSAAINLASFQLQAATGRGSLGARTTPITKDSVAAQLRAGLGATLRFDQVAVGHAECNRYALALVVNGRAHDLLDDPAVAATVLEAMGTAPFDRGRPARRAMQLLGRLAARPRHAAQVLPWALGKLQAMAGDLLAARGRAAKLTLFIHDFMDAAALDRQRIAACAFMVATAEGPMSMCLHNARRDQMLLRPLPGPGGWWNPVSGAVTPRPEPVLPPTPTRRTAKGRVRIEIRHGAP
jgi:molybdenum cofactor biosynthesis enzyme MoaA